MELDPAPQPLLYDHDVNLFGEKTQNHRNYITH